MTISLKLPAHLPTQAEVLAAGRNVASAVGPLLGLAGAFSVLTPAEQQQVLTSFNQIFYGVGEIFKGIKDAWIGFAGLGFLVTLVSAWWARTTAKPANQVAAAAQAVNAGKVSDVAIIPTGPAAPISAPAGTNETIAKAAVAATIQTQVQP